MRAALVLLALPWIAVFVVASRLDPYEDGRVWLEETHRQMGLPPCTFKVVVGAPCPSCGMTSSFALLMRGDLWHSLLANFVGTMLAIFGLLFIPWSLVSAWQGRLLFIRRLDPVLLWLILGFLFVLFGRWFIVLALQYFEIG